MDGILRHIQEYWVLYVILAGVGFPLAYLARRYVGPALLWTAELALYSTVMHVVVHYFIRVTKWFKLSTTMYFEEKIDPGWQTPLVRFWARDLYNPGWIFYVEAALVVLAIVAMIRYRPMKVQKLGRKRERISKGAVPSSTEARYLRNKPPSDTHG